MNNEPQVIDLQKLFGLLLDNKKFIITCTFIFTLIGVAYALLATPVYKADALLQVEKKSTGLPSLSGDMADLFSSESSATTEIEIIRSRMVLGKTVDELNLTTLISPDYLPVIGKGIARLSGDNNLLVISRFVTPDNRVDTDFKLTVVNHSNGKYQLTTVDGNKILTGKVGQLAERDGYRLLVTDMQAENDFVFNISKISRMQAIQNLQENLAVSERGKQTGILQLSFTGSNPQLIRAILNDISENYFLQNVARNAAEAESSLVFLTKQLPDIKQKLTQAEDELNQYRQASESVDLNLEAKSTLESMVALEGQLNELTFKESEISQRFTKQHPAYIALIDKRKTLLQEKSRINHRVEKLPKTQRQILRLMRNVEVNQQIYLQLLNKVQELNIVKASTVGNVRILDNAQVYAAPVKPQKPLIVVLSVLLGGIFSVAIVLLKAAMHRGIENPDDIEAIGLPVYASIPFSEWEEKAEKKNKHKKQLSIEQTLLAVANPADLSIEAFRSLRTSLHFAMLEAKNNIVMISGPSPSVGKSFTSANMGAVIANSNKKVLLIDADMRRGELHKQLATSNNHGLADYLAGQLSLEQLVKPTTVNDLAVICRGTTPPNPSELLMHPRFTALLDWAKQHYDLVIIDTPPLLAVTDAAIVAAHAGTNMLVARFGQNTLKEIEVTRNRFEQNGIEIKGLILNAVIKSASSYYGNYGYYHYQYGEKS
ncbi:tyrosine protein kinase [Shewanella sp. NFH-SH190041]|uniref:polysaccharide biosynthesis tyrosine autokinase n=1 Tax=Shewanella sp. NFH-SH190041 TaxID=2950245 RepID=UPI0021C2F2FB|nr:polysaccharide biosynthesis tyrosine autokinase [Shewanella sp. NFH-SH190041]BDM62838.1 tyrosine protein kinase [Shewanella sp. NFH-SH190041]